MDTEQDLERMRIAHYEAMSGENDSHEKYETERGYDKLASGWVGEGGQEAPTKERHNWFVAVYDTALAWGGPEEGGWWYDHGTLARVVRMFPSEDRAYAYARRLNTKLRNREYGPNKGKRDKSSVLSDGFYEANVYQDYAPDHFPAVRPHYE